MKRLEGKRLIVIGSATGIGAATARRLAAEGAAVVLADIAARTAESVAQEICDDGGIAVALACDIGSEVSVADLFEQVAHKHGGFDGVHVNAADIAIAAQDMNVVDVPLEVFDRTIAINLRGHLLCTRHAVPHLLSRGGGSIVYTSSRGGLTSDVTRVSYMISKSGLHALMRHVALAWGKDGIRANAVAPGTIVTEGLLAATGQAYVDGRLALTPSNRLGTTEDVAASVAFLMSDDAGFINGQILSMDGGVTMR